MPREIADKTVFDPDAVPTRTKPRVAPGVAVPSLARAVLDLQSSIGNEATAMMIQRRPSELATAESELASADSARKKASSLTGSAGDEVAAKELAAEQDAERAAQGVISGRPGAGGMEIESVLRRVEGEISRIESARALGYVQAVSDLSAKGMDKEADYTQFGLATAGNLLWALSGLIPEVGVAKMGFTALKTFFSTAATTKELWSTALGVAGAMTAQFSGGFPSGTSVSSIKVALETSLSSINSAVCNQQRRRVYRLMLGALEAAPPDGQLAVKDYMAQLELGLRYSLYGDIFERGLNSAELVDASKVQQDARDQLLRQYVVGSTAIKDDKLQAIAPVQDQNMVGEAMALVGGPEKLKIKPYELVYNQLHYAATDLGCEIDISEQWLEKELDAEGDALIPVKRWNPDQIFGRGMPTRWLNPLHIDRIVECVPSIDGEAYMSAYNVGQITQIYVLALFGGLSSMEQGGRRIYSADTIEFTAEGGRDTSGFISVTNVPDRFKIVYHIKEPYGRFRRRN